MSKSKKPPYSYYQNMLVSASYSPSTIHTKDTALFHYFMEYLIQKAISVFEWNGIPETWDRSYFLYTLFCYGFELILNTERYGVIPQRCTLTGRNIYDLPSKAIVTNSLLPESQTLTLDEDAVLLKLMPDYGNIMNICSVYADMLACCLETAGVSLMNSKLAYVFFANNKAVAESFKGMFDRISAGEPIAVVDKQLLNPDGTKNWDYFMQNIGQNYISDRVLNDMRTLHNMFNTEIGIRNANTQKRERLISDEVNANNEETRAKIYLWLDSLNEGVTKANKMFNLDLSVRYRYEEEVSDDPGEIVNAGTV